LPSISSSIANARQAAVIRATVTRRDGTRPHGGVISMPPPMRRASWTWSTFSDADAHTRACDLPKCLADKKPASLVRVGGLFRLVIDAKARLEMKHDPTIRAPPKTTASCRSIRSPQRTDRVLLKPSYFAVVGHRLQESVFNDGWPGDVDYSRDLPDCFCAISRRIQHPREPCARTQIILAQVQPRNIDPHALKSGYRLTLRLSMRLAERQ